MILTPFLAFLAAELVHASGVLAVVVCGLLMSRRGPRVGRPEARDQARSFWTLTTYILNGALFVLIGLEVQVLVRGLPSSDLGFGILLGVVVWLALIVVRLAFTFIVTGIIRTVDRRPYQRTLRASTRALIMNSFAGYRGAVSLAAALAIPLDGRSRRRPFPMRDLIVFVTAVVIVLTLAIQGPLLPALIRWARLPAGNEDDERLLAQTEALARRARRAARPRGGSRRRRRSPRQGRPRDEAAPRGARGRRGSEDGAETARAKEQYAGCASPRCRSSGRRCCACATRAGSTTRSCAPAGAARHRGDPPHRPRDRVAVPVQRPRRPRRADDPIGKHPHRARQHLYRSDGIDTDLPRAASRSEVGARRPAPWSHRKSEIPSSPGSSPIRSWKLVCGEAGAHRRDGDPTRRVLAFAQRLKSMSQRLHAP